VRHGLEAFASRRLEPHNVGALRSWKLPKDGVPGGFLKTRLDGPGLEGREPLGEVRLDTESQSRELARRCVKRVLSKEVREPDDILARFEEARAERLEHDLARRVEPAAGQVLEPAFG
jgi:hypothetical protein